LATKLSETMRKLEKIPHFRPRALDLKAGTIRKGKKRRKGPPSFPGANQGTGGKEEKRRDKALAINTVFRPTATTAGCKKKKKKKKRKKKKNNALSSQEVTERTADREMETGMQDTAQNAVEN